MESSNNHDLDNEEDETLHQENNDGDHYIPEDSESQEESQIHNENLYCRFYRKDFPDENDIVLVRNDLYLLIICIIDWDH